MVKTQVQIPDELYRRAKEIAAAEAKQAEQRAGGDGAVAKHNPVVIDPLAQVESQLQAERLVMPRR